VPSATGAAAAVLVGMDQAPVWYQDSVSLLDPPPLRLRLEPPLPRIAFDDLDVDSQAGVVCDDLVLEALVDQSLSDGVTGELSNLVQQDDARGVVVGIRGRGRRPR
jgi:hypothetical protein